MMWSDAEHWRGRGATPAIVGLAVALFGGCEAEFNAAQPHLDTKVYPISCEDGRRYAAADLKARNYRITDVVREGSQTVVSGESLEKKGWRKEIVSSSITVDCQADGVMARASGGGGWWVNDSLRFGYYMFADIGDQTWPPPTVPVVKMALYQGPEAKIEFPTDLEPLGVVAVRVTVLNAGERTLRVDPRDIRAVGEGSQRVPPLSAADAESRLSAADPDIESKLLRPTELEHGQGVTGFAFFPAGSYTGGSLELSDHQTGETDGYHVDFEASAKARGEDREARESVHAPLGSGERCTGNRGNTAPRAVSETSKGISLGRRPGSAEMNGEQRGALRAQKLPRATTEERRWAAIHEAGHAIVAAYFGHTLADVTVESSHAQFVGHAKSDTVLHPGPADKPAPQEGNPDRQLEEKILVALAGPQVERIAGRNEDLVEAGATTDRQHIRAYLDALGCRTPAEAVSEEERLQQELDELLSRLWPSVEPVTRALVQQGAIRYEEIRVLVKGQKELSGQGDD